MPIYEYACGKCREHVEKMQKISDPPLKKCPGCGGPLKKIMSNTSFVLKGGGWYKDGYGSAASSKTESSTSPAPASSGTESAKTGGDTTKTEKKTDKPAKKADKAIAA